MAKLVNKPAGLITEVYKDALRERCKEVEKGLWRTKYKELIPLQKLELSHLANILMLYMNEAPPFNVTGLAERMVKPLLAEARRRGYKEVEDLVADRFELIELE